MASEAPLYSLGLDPTGLPMTAPRWWSRPLRSMSNRLRRSLPRLHRPIGIIVTTRRATTRMSSSALVAGDQSLRPHHERQPSARQEQEWDGSTPTGSRRLMPAPAPGLLL